MYRTDVIFNEVNVGEETADTDARMYIVDFTKDIALREFRLKYKTVCNATAPGANNLVFNIYWSNERIDTLLGSSEDVGVEIAGDADVDAITLALEGDKTTSTKAIVNTASKTVIDDAMDALIRPQARYGYITYDKPALDAGSDITLTVSLVRIPSVYTDLL